MLAVPPIPENEAARLAALEDYQLLDTAPEDVFDSFARAAAQVCGVPIGLISLVDRDRQFFKANIGMGDVVETPRNVSFCAYAILQNGIMEVPDAAADERFRAYPLVTGETGIRFYAGVPLIASGGEALGTLCVLDRTPRELSHEQRTALRAIADAVLEAVESRRAMLRLFDSAQAEIYHLDVQRRRIVFASEAARTNLGYERSELRGISIAELIPELAADDRYEAFVEGMRGGPKRGSTFRSQARRKNGTRYPVEVRAELMQTRERELGLLFLTDLTARNEANRRIEMLSAAVETAQDAVLIMTPPLDAQTPSKIVYANAAYLRQKQVGLDDVVGKSPDVFFGPRTDRAALETFREELLAGKSAHAEYVTYRKDGSDYYVDVSARPMLDADGTVTHFVVVTRDVTDAVMRGMTLELQNERLTALTSIARDLFSALDPRALTQSLLVGVRELTGGEGRLLALRSDGALVETDDLSAAPAAADVSDPFMRTALTAPISVLDDENRRLAIGILGAGRRTAFMLDVRAGEAAFVAADVFAFGLLAQYFAVAARNVELYRELAARRASVVELNQVKNDLIAMLAHDFKGPLTTIVGFADVLAEDDRFDAEARNFLSMISSSALRLASLATDTLALSRLEQNDFSLRVEPVELGELVRDVVRIFSVTRTIDVRIPEGPHLVTGDRGGLRQVFENIIGNAIKYSPGGEAVQIRLRDLADGVEVSVRDRGIGIPDRDRPKLFGRFARGSNARELGIGGTGFGLYLAKKIVEMHGGAIDVASRAGAGSTFSIRIPSSPKPQKGMNRRVLLLDAEGDARSYIAHTLREDGLATSVVATEDDAVAALDGETFDAAVIDVELIGSDEAAFIGRVARRTALVRLGTAGIPAESGWDAALGKPFLIKDLHEAVDRAIGRHAASLARP
jgi:PAS domain S-box-containing protein